MYEFLSCNGDNPCWGWLNANETWRNATSAHARELSAVYPEIIKEYSDKVRPARRDLGRACVCAHARLLRASSATSR